MPKALSAELWSTSIHGVTGQRYCEGYLRPGDWVRAVYHDAANGVWRFQVSTDGGETWWTEESRTAPQFRDAVA